MQGILADLNAEGYLRILIQNLEGSDLRVIWKGLATSVFTFRDLDLDPSTTDRDLWHYCQEHALVLITANRNENSPDSLQATIREFLTDQSLPVLTIGNTRRLLEENQYRRRAAFDLLEYLIDMHTLPGTGRLFLPKSSVF